MFGISFSELLVIFLIAFLVLGPDKLQDFAKSLGKFISGINNFSSNLKDEINISLSPDINKNKSSNDFKEIEYKKDSTNNDLDLKDSLSSKNNDTETKDNNYNDNLKNYF